MDTRFDDITRILARPMPRRRTLRLLASAVAGSTLASLGFERAAAEGARRCGPHDRPRGPCVVRGTPICLDGEFTCLPAPSNELKRFGLAQEAGEFSGRTYPEMVKLFRQVARDEQEGLLPIRMAPAVFQLSAPPDELACVQIVAPPGQDLGDLVLTNEDPSNPVFLVADSRETFMRRILAPGEGVAPPTSPVVAVCAVGLATIAILLTIAVEVIIQTRPAALCVLKSGLLICNACQGECPPGTTCQGTAFSTCWGFGVEPDACGCQT